MGWIAFIFELAAGLRSEKQPVGDKLDHCPCSGDGMLTRLTRSLWGGAPAAPAVVDLQPSSFLGSSAVAALYADASLRFWDTAAAAPLAAVQDVLALAPGPRTVPPASAPERLRCMSTGDVRMHWRPKAPQAHWIICLLPHNLLIAFTIMQSRCRFRIDAVGTWHR